MTVETGAAPSPFTLSDGERELLAERIGDALTNARREGDARLAALTVPIDPTIDPTAVVLGSRAPRDRFFCFEQPDRDGFALAALGAAALVEASGADRFAEASAGARSLARDAFVGADPADPDAPPASGPVWVGGFAFAPEGGAAAEWSS